MKELKLQIRLLLCSYIVIWINKLCKWGHRLSKIEYAENRQESELQIHYAMFHNIQWEILTYTETFKSNGTK